MIRKWNIKSWNARISKCETCPWWLLERSLRKRCFLLESPNPSAAGKMVLNRPSSKIWKGWDLTLAPMAECWTFPSQGGIGRPRFESQQHPSPVSLVGVIRDPISLSKLGGQEIGWTGMCESLVACVALWLRLWGHSLIKVEGSVAGKTVPNRLSSKIWKGWDFILAQMAVCWTFSPKGVIGRPGLETRQHPSPVSQVYRKD